MKHTLPKSRQIKGVALGITVSLVGLIFFWSPNGFDIEEQYGLEWLFRLRGPILPPTDTVIVTLDRKSARKLALSEKPDRWPRSLHGQLIEHLHAACVKTIVFDLYFRESQESLEDQVLAKSIKTAGNVVLMGHLGITENEAVPYETRPHVQTLFLPIPELATAAVTVAPFVLPNTAHGVTGYWPFMSSAGDLPTLPTVAYYLYLSGIPEILNQHIEQLESKIGFRSKTKTKSITADLRSLRSALKISPRLGVDLLTNLKHSGNKVFTTDMLKKLSSFIHLLKKGDWFYLNFYGPPGTIKTIGYAELIETPPPSLCHHDNPFFDKTVLIGVSESSPVEQKDKDIFETVFPGPNGLKMSGIEIMATAINNLIENNRIRRINITTGCTLILTWGMIVSIVWRSLNTRDAFFFTVAALLAYFSAAAYTFQAQNLWFPLTIPLIQTIFSVPLAIARNRSDLAIYIKSVHNTLRDYLPNSVIEQIVQSPTMLTRATGEVFGTCLHTDITGFTSLCSKKEPLEISRVMAAYYQAIARPVSLRDGIVADQTGDSMLALWAASKPDIYLRHQACEGALDIAKAVRHFSFNAGASKIPTRIGLHAGRIAIGETNFNDARQLRSFGLIVNLSQRLENLNVILGTQILISENAISGLTSFLQRPVGTFLLKGMKAPLKIYELRGRKSDKLVIDQEEKDQEWLCDSFADVLTAYSNQHWQETIERLLEILDIFPNDGPSLFYLKRSELLRNNPNSVHWDPIIYL